MKRLLLAVLLGATVLSTAACDRAISNMQTLVSDDCGRTWRLIQVGGTVPSRVGACALKVTVPNYPMAGDAAFKVNFKNSVLVTVSAGYEYTITDPLKFISNARYIGRQNSAGDGEANASSQYESAENILIDKRIREVADGLLDDEDIVDFDQSAFETTLLVAVNEVLAPRGVQLNSIAFVPTPDAQTRMAIDVVAADRVYVASGMQDIGRQIMVARAGAPSVVVNNNTPASAPAND